MRNLSKDSLETKETFLKLELVRAVHASRNIKHAGNFRKDYLLGAELQEHILRFSEIKYVWRYSAKRPRTTSANEWRVCARTDGNNTLSQLLQTLQTRI